MGERYDAAMKARLAQHERDLLDGVWGRFYMVREDWMRIALMANYIAKAYPVIFAKLTNGAELPPPDADAVTDSLEVIGVEWRNDGKVGENDFGEPVTLLTVAGTVGPCGAGDRVRYLIAGVHVPLPAPESSDV